jgi:predicted enzyme related to lactoylglutathione lyase
MAVVQDPAGAVLAAWEPGAHFGAQRVNDVGCMTWNELQSREPEEAATFYSELFGWETEPHEYEGKVAYVTIQNAGSINGGVMPMTEANGAAPPHWLPYFTVASCDGAIAKTRELGGRVLAGPIDLPQPGRIAVLMDPQGAAFAVFEGETDD